VSLVSSRGAGNIIAHSNKGDISFDFDDDAYKPKVDLRAFRLRIRPTTNILDCQALDELLCRIELKMETYLINTGDDFVESVRISRTHQQRFNGNPVAVARTGCVRRRSLTRDYGENTNSERELQGDTYTTELDMIGVTIFLNQDQHPSEENLMYQLQKAVHSIEAASAISIGNDSIDDIILLWGAENYTLRPAVVPSSMPSVIPSIRLSKEPTQELIRVPSGVSIQVSSAPSGEPISLTTNLSPELPKAPYTSDRLMHDPTFILFVGLGVVTLFSGGLFMIRRRRRNIVNDDNNSPSGCVTELQGVHFLYGHRGQRFNTMNIDVNENENEIEVSPPAICHIPPYNQDMSDISMRSDEFGKEIEDIEHVWMRNGAPKMAGYMMDDHYHHVTPKLASNSNPHPYYETETSSSNLEYSTNSSQSSLLNFSAPTAKDNQSSRGGLEPDRNWDPNDNEINVDDNGEESFSPSKLNGATLNTLDRDILNPLDSFSDLSMYGAKII